MQAVFVGLGKRYGRGRAVCVLLASPRGEADNSNDRPKRQKQTSQSDVDTIVPGDSVSAVGPPGSGNTQIRSSGYVSPPATVIKNAKRHSRDLSVEGVLAGDPKRWNVYQARRAIEALEKSNPFAPEVLEWKARYPNLLKAQALLEMDKLTPQQRTSHLQDLLEAGVVKWPCKIQAQCLNIYLREACLKQPLDCKEIMRVLQPGGSLEGFDPLHPTLSSCSLPEEEKAKLFLRVAVQHLLVPLVVSERIAEIKEMSTTIYKSLADADPSKLSPVFVGAVSELQDCAFALLALLNPLEANAVAAVDSVTKAASGVKQLLRNAIAASKKFQHLEGRLRKCEAATLAMGPQVKEFTAQLQVGPSAHLIHFFEQRNMILK